VETQLEPEFKPIVEDLLKLKMSTSEIGEIPKIVALNDFINTNLGVIRRQIGALPAMPQSGWKTLNDVFLSILEL